MNKIKRVLRLEKGQSLVEMAIIAPILILFLIGVFEVGWALRSYLVLVNVNREITRFAVRPGYMNFSTQENVDASYQRVRNWASTTVSEQLDLDFSPTGASTVIVSHLVVDTGKPCEDIGDSECDDCNAFDDPTYNPFPQDDVIIHPGISKFAYQAQRFGPASTVTGPRATHLDYEALASDLAAKNNKFNCEVLKKGGVPSSNNVIVTEMFQDMPQLFGFPMISNPYTDPLPLYTHTTMRLIGAARSTGTVEGNITSGIDQIGEVCFAFPVILHEDNIPGPSDNQIIDILDGPGQSQPGANDDRGFIGWSPFDDSEEDLEWELEFPQMSVNGYKNPNNLDDTELNVGDWAGSIRGNNAGVHSSTSGYNIENLIGVKIIIPVYDIFDTGISAYHIVDFVEVIMQPDGIDLTGNNPKIMAQYVGPAPDACK